MLRNTLRQWIEPDDYLMRLIEQRIASIYQINGVIEQAAQGVPFGTPVACVLANVFLTGLDHRLDAIPELTYFRYADDLLGISADADVIRHAGHGVRARPAARSSVRTACVSITIPHCRCRLARSAP